MMLFIGADLVPTKNNVDSFCDGNIEKIIDHKIIELLRK